MKSRDSVSPATPFWSSSVVHSSQTQAVCKAWLGHSSGNKIYFHTGVHYVLLKIMMERLSRAEEAAQHFHGLLQHEGMQSACFVPYPHCSDPENSLPQKLQPVRTAELLTNKWRMFLLRTCMKIHPFLLIHLTMLSRAQWEHGLTLQDTKISHPGQTLCMFCEELCYHSHWARWVHSSRKINPKIPHNILE